MMSDDSAQAGEPGLREVSGQPRPRLASFSHRELLPQREVLERQLAVCVKDRSK